MRRLLTPLSRAVVLGAATCSLGLAQVVRSDLMALTRSNNLAFVDQNTSINDNGRVAFTGAVGGLYQVLVADAPGAARVLSTSDSRTNHSGAAINNQFPARVASRRRRSLAWTMFLWPSEKNNPLYSVGRSPTHFDSCSLHCDANDNGVVAFPALVNQSRSIVLMAATFARSPVRLATYSGSYSMRPQIANNGLIVLRDKVGRIIAWPYPSGNPIVAAGTSWQATGQAPGISRDGSTIAFVETRGSKTGVWVSVKTAAGRALLPVAGAGLKDGLSGFDGYSRIAVQSHAMDASGSKRVITVWFHATRKVGSHTEKGLFSSTITFDGLFASTRTVAALVLVGMKLAGSRVASTVISDAPNAYGDVAALVVLDDNRRGPLRISRYPKWSQGDTRWACDRYGNYPGGCDDACTKKTPNATCCPQTIKRWGCYMTSLAMVVRSLGVEVGADGNEVNPRNLNRWLRASIDGYTKGSSGCYQTLNAGKVYAYTNRQVRFLGWSGKGYGLADVAKDLEAGRRVILDVGGHFVVATGVVRSAPNTIKTLRIHDPGNRNRVLLSDPKYKNTFKSARRFEREVGAASTPWIVISARSPIELLVRDKNGKRTGFDPRNQTAYAEIPGSSYGVDRIVEDGGTGTVAQVSPKWLVLPRAELGTYQVEVLGTGAGSYAVYANSVDTRGRFATRLLNSGTAKLGSRTAFGLAFDPNRGVVQSGIRRVGEAGPSCSGPFVFATQGGSAKSPNAQFALAIASAPPKTAAAVFLAGSAKANALRLLGATLHFDLGTLVTVNAHAVDAEGRVRVPLPLPSGVRGLRFALQAIALDNGKCKGRQPFASSAGLELTLQ